MEFGNPASSQNSFISVDKVTLWDPLLFTLKPRVRRFRIRTYLVLGSGSEFFCSQNLDPNAFWPQNPNPNFLCLNFLIHIPLVFGSGFTFLWFQDLDLHSSGFRIWINIPSALGSLSAFLWPQDPDPHSLIPMPQNPVLHSLNFRIRIRKCI